jgi:UDP-N-acetylglucosamine 2-epimerase
MRNICVVVTARPSWSRIKTACEAIKKYPDLTLTLVLAGSACALVDEIRAQGFESSAEVPILRGKYTKISMAKTASTGVHELASLFEGFDPDIVVTIADRYETLATAVAASYLGIPLAHTGHPVSRLPLRLDR